MQLILLNSDPVAPQQHAVVATSLQLPYFQPQQRRYPTPMIIGLIRGGKASFRFCLLPTTAHLFCASCTTERARKKKDSYNGD